MNNNPSIDDLFVKIAAKGILNNIVKFFKGSKKPGRKPKTEPPKSLPKRIGEAATIPAVILGGGTVAGAYVSSQGGNEPYVG
jgi:hypothetical protein